MRQHRSVSFLEWQRSSRRGWIIKSDYSIEKNIKNKNKNKIRNTTREGRKWYEGETKEEGKVKDLKKGQVTTSVGELTRI